MRNWLPCSHCLSNSWSNVCGIAPPPRAPAAFEFVLLLVENTDENDVAGGAAGWLDLIYVI